MKAVRFHAFGEPDVLKLEEIPDPKPDATQLLVKVKAVGVNPVDTYIRAGKYGTRPLPFIPGSDAAGIVENVGAKAGPWRKGDRVYFYGPSAYAEFVIATPAQVHHLPEHTNFAQGAAIGVPYATAFFALFGRGLAKEGETVLIHGGSGGVGTAAVQLARARGLTVIATAGTDKGRALVKKEGAHHALDHHAPDFDKQLLELTAGRGVDLIIEMLANINLGKDLKLLTPKGRVIVVGSRGTVEIDPRDLFLKHADIRGLSLMTVSEPELAGIHAALVAGLENGSLKPVIGQELPLADAAKAHRAVLEAGAHGKIILNP